MLFWFSKWLWISVSLRSWKSSVWMDGWKFQMLAWERTWHNNFYSSRLFAVWALLGLLFLLLSVVRCWLILHRVYIYRGQMHIQAHRHFSQHIRNITIITYIHMYICTSMQVFVMTCKKCSLFWNDSFVLKHMFSLIEMDAAAAMDNMCSPTLPLSALLCSFSVFSQCVLNCILMMSTLDSLPWIQRNLENSLICHLLRVC